MSTTPTARIRSSLLIIVEGFVLFLAKYESRSELESRHLDVNELLDILYLLSVTKYKKTTT